jgi:AcrR family transcriptional regulator
VNVVHVVNVIHKEAAFVPHARRREDKTAAVLDAAMALLAAEGLEGVTLQRVAQRLGVVTTALYRYFPAKDALLAALQRRAVAEVHAHLAAELARVPAVVARHAPEVAAIAPVLHAARTYLALPRTRPEAFRLLALLIGDPRVLIADEEAARTTPLVTELLADIARTVAQAAEAGALEPGDPLARTIALWATLHGLTQLEKLRRVAPHAPDAGALADAAVAALLRGFGASPDVLARARRALDRLAPSDLP